jgi:hypothetical protein
VRRGFWIGELHHGYAERGVDVTGVNLVTLHRAVKIERAAGAGGRNHGDS